MYYSLSPALAHALPPPPVERAPGGSVLRASTPWGVLHCSTEHRAVGGKTGWRATRAMARAISAARAAGDGRAPAAAEAATALLAQLAERIVCKQ